MQPLPSTAPEVSAPHLGRYELLGELASGGMATVHLARLVGAGGFERLFAIKRCHAHLCGDEEFVAMFLDEARLAARLEHPNVVATVDAGDEGSGPFLVMEYVDGEQLSRLARAAARRGERVPVPVALRIACDALAGLHHAHELTDDAGEPLGIVHRDVSPQNILVGANGVTKIADFGIAKARSRATVTREGMLKGKLAYMAPEQARGTTEVTRRADVFSAGVLLWEVLAGQSLFRGDSDAATAARLLRCAVEPPSRHAPELPAALDAAVLKALHADPAARFATAEEFAAALLACGARVATHREVAAFVGDVLGGVLSERRRAIVASRAQLATPTGASRAALATALAASRPASTPTPEPSIPRRGSDAGLEVRAHARLLRGAIALAGASGLLACAALLGLVLRAPDRAAAAPPSRSGSADVPVQVVAPAAVPSPASASSATAAEGAAVPLPTPRPALAPPPAPRAERATRRRVPPPATRARPGVAQIAPAAPRTERYEPHGL